MLESAMAQWIVSRPAINALIGYRLYPAPIPQDADMPSVAYQRISAPRSYSHDGQTSVVPARIQFTIEAATRDDAKEIAEAFRGELSGYSGTMNGVEIDAVFLLDDTDDNADTHDYAVVRVDYRFMYHE